ncbi:MAG: choice-of-anchor E domain-containing protein [Planctomycetota bacterium]|nr:choice-of-anchor E domain-containing protein [Planctomycetota bacterium]
MKTLRSSLVALALASSALTASAQQTQTTCFTDSIPLQSTNWGGSVSIPKFNPNLGTLQSISFQLTGNVQGSAKAESLDASSTIVNTSFAATITLTRPDLTPLVVTLPIANFSDSFTAFDGVIDFAGTSGMSHLNINATDTQSQVSPPPLSDLALFTGAGNIVLPVTAQGSSIATGAGNLITQFTTSAAADVRVCYTYVPNTPPALQCPGTLMASAGVPLQFQICASDIDPTDTVTLTAANVPAGMTFTPALPTSGNPVCVTVDWTPNGTQVGNFNVVFTATDAHQRTSSCTVTIVSAECHLLVSSGTGNAGATIFGHYYDTQLAGVRRTWPVTMEDMPSFAWNQLPQVITVQVVMYNPLMFPANPDQHSQAMRVTKTAQGTLNTEYFGTTDGIGIRAQVYTVNGQPRVRFPFRVQGM